MVALLKANGSTALITAELRSHFLYKVQITREISHASTVECFWNLWVFYFWLLLRLLITRH